MTIEVVERDQSGRSKLTKDLATALAGQTLLDSLIVLIGMAAVVAKKARLPVELVNELVAAAFSDEETGQA